SCFFSSYLTPLDLLFFPTRRSSDLYHTHCFWRHSNRSMDIAKLALEDGTAYTGKAFGARGERDGEVALTTCAKSLAGINRPIFRSEEHTSELQSLTNLVCRLLLDKK